jgi:uncharacterized repeat protein (TIGR01451 family)
MKRLTMVAALAATTWWLLAGIAVGGASAATPFKDIASTGPLEHVYLGDELSCQIDHTADTLLQFFPPQVIPGDCGTFVALGGNLYAPDFNSHGNTATIFLGTYTPFTPVSQTNVTGTGTAADPFRVVTVADVGLTGLRIQQTDSYIIGDEAYRTDVTISNSGVAAQSGLLYRAGDCFLGGTDFGFGFTEVFGIRNAVGCSMNANNTPPGRIEEWVPLTGGNTFYQAHYSEVWTAIGAKTAFPDTCECAQFQDNGAGISWSFDVPAGGSLTFLHITTFSPTGKEPLTTSKTPDSATSTVGTQNGYTITIANPNPDAVTLNAITDTLPVGFTYVPGSTSGVTTGDPAVTGQTLRWNGPFTVPANGNVTLHFNVIVSTTPGDYFNEASGEAAGGYTVIATGPTAKITVTPLTADLSVTKTDSPDPVQVGQELTYTITVANAGPNPAANVTLSDTLPGTVTLVSAIPSQGTCSGTTTITCNLGAIAASSSATVTIKVIPNTDADLTNTASASSATADPNPANDSDTEATVVNPAPVLTLDHFKCYRLGEDDDDDDDGEDRNPVSRVTLRDQFGSGDVLVDEARELCTPAAKDGSSVSQPSAHLVMYRIKSNGRFSTRRVEVTNQFGTHVLKVRKPKTLAVPSSKSLTGDPGPPPTMLDHFQCYRVSGGHDDDDHHGDDDDHGSASRRVELKDQFMTETVQVRRPVALCNPVEKTHDGVVTPIGSPTKHLVCYSIKAARFSATVNVRNQFGDATLSVGRPHSLCVPSEKSDLPPPPPNHDDDDDGHDDD